MKNIQLFVSVDESGNILKAFSGESIIGSDPYDYWFLTDDETADNVGSHKVVIVDMKPQLVLKEGVL